MYCVNCGKQIVDSAKFCNYCGTPTVFGAPVPQRPAQTNVMPSVQPVRNIQPVQDTQPPVQNEQAAAPSEPVSASAPVYETLRQSVSEAESVLTEEAASEPAADVTETESAANVPAAENAPEAPEETAAPEAPEAPTDSDGFFSQPVPPFPAVSAVPMPGTIPTEGASVPQINAASEQVPVFSAAPEAPASPERKYTLTHIMLCLGAVAIFAITAGVFAGLYFSVV